MENNKKINLGFFEDEEETSSEIINEKEEIRQDVGNDEKTENINENSEKNIYKKIIDLDVNLIEDKDKQPFKIREETEDFKRLKESIEILGIKNPLQLVENGEKYKIIEGHRRLYIAKQLNMKNVPCIIVDLQLVDGNITQREKLLTSEIVKAYKLKTEALKNLGYYSEESKQQIAEEENKSVRTIERYLKLSNLIDEFLDFIDIYEETKERGISRSVGLILSDIKEEKQKIIYNYIEEKNIIITDKQAKEIKNCEQIDEKILDSIINKKEKIDKRKSLSIPYKKVESFFSSETSKEEQIETIIKALENYFKSIQ